VSLDKWRRHHVVELPQRAMFVQVGDLGISSLGWYNRKVWVFENI